jgi:hypothetical protein
LGSFAGLELQMCTVEEEGSENFAGVLRGLRCD